MKPRGRFLDPFLNAAPTRQFLQNLHLARRARRQCIGGRYSLPA